MNPGLVTKERSGGACADQRGRTKVHFWDGSWEGRPSSWARAAGLRTFNSAEVGPRRPRCRAERFGGQFVAYVLRHLSAFAKDRDLALLPH
jgi:hypothetical protein